MTSRAILHVAGAAQEPEAVVSEPVKILCPNCGRLARS